LFARQIARTNGLPARLFFSFRDSRNIMAPTLNEQATCRGMATSPLTDDAYGLSLKVTTITSSSCHIDGNEKKFQRFNPWTTTICSTPRLIQSWRTPMRARHQFQNAQIIRILLL